MNNTEKAHAYTMALTMQALGHTTPAQHTREIQALTPEEKPQAVPCRGGCERRVWEWHARFERDHTTGTYNAYCPEC